LTNFLRDLGWQDDYGDIFDFRADALVGSGLTLFDHSPIRAECLVLSGEQSRFDGPTDLFRKYFLGEVGHVNLSGGQYFFLTKVSDTVDAIVNYVEDLNS
jgi:hypothetical protein